ncbi:MAG: RNA helicase required for poly(A+) mRNA export [Chaenotheca gracillima]|nr:MAG: RNA helicase required for poly(A+) mRNA export [Chaenotheca gracillima]
MRFLPQKYVSGRGLVRVGVALALISGLLVLVTHYDNLAVAYSNHRPSHRPVVSPPLPLPGQPLAGGMKSLPWFDGFWNTTRDGKNRMLTDSECDLAFPGLYDDIERSVTLAQWSKISKKKLDKVDMIVGMIRGFLYDQQLFVNSTGPLYHSRTEAVLHALHRAVVTSPEPLPDVDFLFGTLDNMPADTIAWGFTNDVTLPHIWLMPDFGFWSWPEPKVSSFEEQQRHIVMQENGYPGAAPAKSPEEDRTLGWTKKDPRLAWRGAILDVLSREQLVNQTRDKPWADVRILDWKDEEAVKRDRMEMSDHCRYKFVAQTEGWSNSGRLKHLLNCRSVVMMPPIHWREHFHPLLQSSGPDQNYVEVAPDWSDVEEKISELLRDDAKAQRIADNSVRTFRERYLSLAAETCYWRKLIRGWATVSHTPDVFRIDGDHTRMNGVSLEDYVLMRQTGWEPH